MDGESSQRCGLGEHGERLLERPCQCQCQCQWRCQCLAMALAVALLPTLLAGSRTSLTLAAEPPSATVPIQLAAPMRSQWKVLDEGLSMRDLRLELRLGPKGIPKYRFVGSTILRAERDTTWIEFTGSRLDQVLKLRVDCRGERELEVVVTPHVQPNAGSATVRYTEVLERRMKVYAELSARRAEFQMRMLGAVPGGKDGKATTKSSAQLTPAGERTRMMADYEYKASREAQERLMHLDALRDKLEGTAELQIRVTRVDDPRPVSLEIVSRPASGAVASGTMGPGAW